MHARARTFATFYLLPPPVGAGAAFRYGFFFGYFGFHDAGGS